MVRTNDAAMEGEEQSRWTERKRCEIGLGCGLLLDWSTEVNSKVFEEDDQ